MVITIDFYLRCRLDTNFVIYLGKLKDTRSYLDKSVQLQLVIA